MHDLPPFIQIRKTPGADPAVLRWGRWRWACLISDCRTTAYGLGSQQAALHEACRHLAHCFDLHHAEELSHPAGNRHYIRCRCGWECDNERNEQAAEYALETHIHELSKALERVDLAWKAAA